MFRKLVALFLLGLFSAPLWANECEVKVEATDQMQFSTNVITVDKSCKTFTVNLVHTGQMDKNVMGHNWVLSTAADMQPVITDGSAAGLDNEYLKDDDPRVIAHTKVIGGGEKDEAKIDVSKLTAGEEYMFYCTFPGHSAMMKGTLVVK